MKSSQRSSMVLHILRVFVCLSLAVANLYADVIYLHDGNVLLVEKAWIEGDQVKYQTSRGVRSVPKSRVRDIQAENPLPPPSPSAKKWSLESVVDEAGTNLKGTPSNSTGDAVSNESLTRLRQNLSTNPGDPRAQSELIQALNSVAWLQMTQGDLPGARRSLEEALKLNTRDPAITSNLAVVHLRMSNYRAAEDLLKAALSLDRNNQETYFLLGATYYAQEKIDLAINEWTAGLRLGPHPEMSASLDKALKEERVHDQLGELQSAHFILRYDQKVSDQRLGQQILATLEELYTQLTADLMSRPPATIAVILYPNQTYFDITKAPTWTGAMFDGKIRVPTRGLSSVTPDLKSTLKHELTHAFIAVLPQDCPTWFNEGVAQWQEGHSAASYRNALAQMRRTDRLIPLKNLEGSFTGLPEVVAEIAYAEGLSATEFMIAQHGRGSVRSILELMAQNYNFESAVKTALKISLAEFESAWARNLSQ